MDKKEIKEKVEEFKNKKLKDEFFASAKEAIRAGGGSNSTVRYHGQIALMAVRDFLKENNLWENFYKTHKNEINDFLVKPEINHLWNNFVSPNAGNFFSDGSNEKTEYLQTKARLYTIKRIADEFSGFLSQ